MQVCSFVCMYHNVCKIFREECKKLPGLNSGWIAATKKFIVLFNEGKVTLRSRGKKNKSSVVPFWRHTKRQ